MDDIAAGGCDEAVEGGGIAAGALGVVGAVVTNRED